MPRARRPRLPGWASLRPVAIPTFLLLAGAVLFARWAAITVVPASDRTAGLRAGDRLLVRRGTRLPPRGALVVVTAPSPLVARVVALPGERLVAGAAGLALDDRRLPAWRVADVPCRAPGCDPVRLAHLFPNGRFLALPRQPAGRWRAGAGLVVLTADAELRAVARDRVVGRPLAVLWSWPPGTGWRGLRWARIGLPLEAGGPIG